MKPDYAAEIVAAYAAHGSHRKAARALNMKRSTYANRLRDARRVLNCPEGFELARVSTMLDADGDPRSTSVIARPARGEVHDLPEGHALRRVSALIDADGRVIQKWVISTPEGQRIETLAAALRAELADTERLAPIDAPGFTDDDLLTLYPIADQHHGLYSWAAETGDDYDLSISERLLKQQLSRLVSLAPPSRRAVVLGLGDFFHTDGHDAVTVASRNQLDRDGRQAKVQNSGIRLMRWSIDLALTKHELVHVTIRAGNHDPMSALWLAECIAIAYENEPRVIVDLDPSLFWYARFGEVLLSATHGHTCKPADFPSMIAAATGTAWGESAYRYGFQGHIHHETVIEKGGVRVETFQTIAGKDAWHAGKPYLAGRSMTAITYHRELGEVGRIKSPVRIKAMKSRVIEL
jgi:hypothetical protein